MAPEVKSVSRFACEKYSRSERRKRELGRHVPGQVRITAYYPILNQIEVTLRSNEEMIKSLSARCEELAACVSDFNSNNSNLSYLLKLLMETAKKNSSREKHGRRYDLDLKYFATYLFIVAGPFVYDFLQKNLSNSLPSISEVERTLASTAAPVKEGQFRFDELDKFLESHELPRKVFVSEDGTRILQRFLYDLTSDQIIGGVPPMAENGVPLINSFPAFSAAMIASHFEKGTPSSSAYAIMAQPLQEGAPSFCLAIFGTDNKFTSPQVFKRWNYIYEELLKRQIEVVGFGSDGDPKLLSAMHSHMFQPGETFVEEFQDFYFASGGKKFVVMQDFIHTVNKFRTRLDPANYLPIGKFTASQAHLRILSQERSKEEHGLTTADLDKSDKMNFNSSLKICSERITDLLEKYVPGSEGTEAYLKVMRFVMEAGLDESLAPLEKIYKIWYSVFFLRFWKNWLTSHAKFNLDNFVSRNLYMCVEIIAHSMIYLIIKFRDENCPESLIFHIFSSQACESFFRLARSMTTTESTVINFSMKEFLQKVRRIDMLHHVSSKLNDKLVFPREKRKRLLGILTAEKLKSTYLPSNAEIRITVLQAKNDAISVLRKLGVVCPPDSSMSKIKTSVLSCKNFEAEFDADEILTGAPGVYEATIDEDDIPLDLLATFPSPEAVVDLNPHGEISSEVPLPAKSSHVQVPDGKGGFRTMSKSLFCWILSSVGGVSLDSVRVKRVREKILSSLGGLRASSSTSLAPAKRDEVEIGNWCIFKDKKSLIVAQIIGFCYLSGTGKCQKYTLLKAPIQPPEGKVARGIGCMGMWYYSQGNQLKILSSQHKYIDIANYLATVPAPVASESGLQLSPAVCEYLLRLQNK